MEPHRMFLQVAVHGASDAETAIARKEGGLHRWDGLEKVNLGDVGMRFVSSCGGVALIIVARL